MACFFDFGGAVGAKYAEVPAAGLGVGGVLMVVMSVVVGA